MRHFGLRLAATAIVLSGLTAISAPAQAPELQMLNKVQLGLWNIRERGKSDLVDKICVRDARKLLQIRHRNAQCSRFIITDQPDEVTVSYKCPGSGHGRTTIRYEDSGLLQISSQGIADNSPFSFAVEGRFAGACGGDS